MVVVIRRVCLLNDLHLPLFQRVGVCLRGEKGIRVREHRVLVPGVGHGLPPLLRRQLAPGRHIPGLDLARGVLVHPAVLSGGVLHAVAQVQQLPEPRVRIELFIDGVLLGLQPVIPPPRFRVRISSGKAFQLTPQLCVAGVPVSVLPAQSVQDLVVLLL